MQGSNESERQRGKQENWHGGGREHAKWQSSRKKHAGMKSSWPFRSLGGAISVSFATLVNSALHEAAGAHIYPITCEWGPILSFLKLKKNSLSVIHTARPCSTSSKPLMGIGAALKKGRRQTCLQAAMPGLPWWLPEALGCVLLSGAGLTVIKSRGS